MARESLSEEVTFKLDCGMGGCQACEELTRKDTPGREKSHAQTLGWEELISLSRRSGVEHWGAVCRGGAGWAEQLELLSWVRTLDFTATPVTQQSLLVPSLLP